MLILKCVILKLMEADGKNMQKHFWTSVLAQHFFRSESQPVATLQVVSFCVNQCKYRYGILVRKLS